MQSNMRLQSLQFAFKLREKEKIDAHQVISRLKKQLELLLNEKQIVGDYLNSIDVGMECKIKNMFIVDVGDPVQDSEGILPLGILDRFPQSLEVTEIYLSGVQEKNALLANYIASDHSCVA